ncbi:MAG: SGNH/GDSL hydrolase family protein [Bacteroidia bacterium]|nr:SGNH/GDSL hydrolase family protein [Bacteroidia bacterium]
MKLKNKIVVFFEVLFILAIPYLWSINYIEKIIGSNIVLIWCWRLAYILRVLLLFHLLLLVLKRFYINVIKANLPDKKANKKLLSTTLISIFIFAEIVFSFVPQSQGNGQVDLGQRLWQAYFGKPINELGYRDNELKGRINSNKKKLIFLGDSFTYGSGIENYQDRYSDIIKNRVGVSFEVFNLGKCQSDTRDELERLKAFQAKPDVLILQYFHNDIIPVGMRYGYFDYRESKKNSQTKLLNTLIIPFKSSFFLNFLFVNVGNKLVSSLYSSWYKNDINESFKNKYCLEEHTRDIEDLIHYCQIKEIKLYVLFIPDLTDIEYTQTIYSDKIVPVLKKENIAFVYIADCLKGYAADKLLVNAVDMHANEFVQKIIAEQLLLAIPELREKK